MQRTRLEEVDKSAIHNFMPHGLSVPAEMRWRLGVLAANAPDRGKSGFSGLSRPLGTLQLTFSKHICNIPYKIHIVCKRRPSRGHGERPSGTCQCPPGSHVEPRVPTAGHGDLLRPDADQNPAHQWTDGRLPIRPGNANQPLRGRTSTFATIKKQHSEQMPTQRHLALTSPHLSHQSLQGQHPSGSPQKSHTFVFTSVSFTALGAGVLAAPTTSKTRPGQRT
jgi:hypothetical protein